MVFSYLSCSRKYTVLIILLSSLQTRPAHSCGLAPFIRIELYFLFRTTVSAVHLIFSPALECVGVRDETFRSNHMFDLSSSPAAQTQHAYDTTGLIYVLMYIIFGFSTDNIVVLT